MYTPSSGLSRVTTSWITYCEECTNVTWWPYLSVWVKCPCSVESAWQLRNPDIISIHYCSLLNLLCCKTGSFCIAWYFGWYISWQRQTEQSLTLVTSSTPRPALHQTVGDTLSHIEVGVQLTSRLLYNLMHCAVEIWALLILLSRIDPLRLHLDVLHSAWLEYTHTHKGTPQLGVGWMKTQLEEISSRCGVK